MQVSEARARELAERMRFEAVRARAPAAAALRSALASVGSGGSAATPLGSSSGANSGSASPGSGSGGGGGGWGNPSGGGGFVPLSAANRLSSVSELAKLGEEGDDDAAALRLGASTGGGGGGVSPPPPVAGLRRTASVANLMPAGARSISATHFSGLSLVRLNELTDSIVRAGSARWWSVPQPPPLLFLLTPPARAHRLRICCRPRAGTPP
jgi:hypothetical protein